MRNGRRMAFAIIITLIVALVIFVSVQRAKARQRALINGVRQTVRQVSGEPVTLKQGNVTVRVKTSADTEDVRFGSAAEAIAAALSNITPEQLQSQAEAALGTMRENGNMQLTEEQRQAIQAAFRDNFGGRGTVSFDPQPVQDLRRRRHLPNCGSESVSCSRAIGQPCSFGGTRSQKPGSVLAWRRL